MPQPQPDRGRAPAPPARSRVRPIGPVPVPAPAQDPRRRASNVHVPATLLPRIEAARAATGLSTGDLIVTALEAVYPDLPALLHPQVAGGSLFAPRPTRTRTHGPLLPVNYRLPPADFAVIDRLVEETGATSRSHLITTALTAYLHRPDAAPAAKSHPTAQPPEPPVEETTR